MNEAQFLKAQEFIDKANSILVLITDDAPLDVLAASSALVLSLQNSGKQVVFASPKEIKNAPEFLNGLDLLKTDISNQNLIVSFAYEPSAVEKVSYHIGEETSRFYLTVQPQKGAQPLDKNSLEINYQGANADLIILVGVHDLEDLGQLYLSEPQIFSDTVIMTIHTFEPEVGNVHLTSEENANLSDCVAQLIKIANYDLSAEVATNLLFSLERTTKNFTSLSITPEILETAAWLLRNGARRVRVNEDEVRNDERQERGNQRKNRQKKKSKSQIAQKTKDDEQEQPSPYGLSASM